jgi:FkbM family methyltransferase
MEKILSLDLMIKKSSTQFGYLKYLENIFRCHPLSYLIARNLSKILKIFEADAKGLKKIQFNKKINCIDVGASDGVFINYIVKNLDVKKVICYEPNPKYVNELKKIKNVDLKIFEHGLGSVKKSEKLYLPFYNFFSKKFYLDAYTFPVYENCKKQIELDFIFKKNIFIEERIIFISNEIYDEDNIDLIKIDINGNEIDIIRSLILIIQRDKPVIYIENNFEMDEIIKILKIYDYSPYLYELNDNKFYPFKNEEVLNVFFINNNSNLNNTNIKKNNSVK